MPPVIVTTDVDRPAADVFAYATDPARFQEWQAGGYVSVGMLAPVRV